MENTQQQAAYSQELGSTRNILNGIFQPLPDTADIIDAAQDWKNRYHDHSNKYQIEQHRREGLNLVNQLVAALGREAAESLGWL